MEDTILVCKQCGARFVFKVSEQMAYERKGFSSPNRCPDCRKNKAKLAAPQMTRSKMRKLRDEDDWR